MDDFNPILKNVFRVSIFVAAVAVVMAFLEMKKSFEKEGRLLEDRIVAAQRINERVMQAQTVTTERLRTVESALTEATRSNLSLRSEVQKLGGIVSSVGTGSGQVIIGGGHTDTVTTADFDVSIDDDPWVAFRIKRAGNILNTSYRTTFSLHETDVEVLLPDGAKTHLYDVAVVSDVTGDTLRIPVVRQFVERSFPAPPIRLKVAPRAHGAVVLAGEDAAPAIGASLLGLGPRWAFLRADAAFRDGASLGIAPVVYNVGDPLPLLTNLQVAAGWFVFGRSGFYFSVGVIL